MNANSSRTSGVSRSSVARPRLIEFVTRLVT